MFHFYIGGIKVFKILAINILIMLGFGLAFNNKYSFAKNNKLNLNKINGKDKLPFSDKVVVGELENGLTYYIRHNDLPIDKLELRLNVRSGSLDETDEERGIAHFVEHMAFNGTKNFKGNDVIKFMEQAGLTFGQHSNASTSTDYTNYQLTIPTENSKLVDDAFKILRDWADGITFDEKEVQKEKDIIIEEWRSRNTAFNRIRVKTREMLFEGSKYRDRDPIGLVEIISNADSDLLRGYYDKWYVPSNMSIIVVGDIDIDEAEKLIKKYFSSLKSKEIAKKADKTIDIKNGLRFKIISDKEAVSTSVSLMYLTDNERVRTYDDLERKTLNQAAINMLNRRVSSKILEDKTDIINFGSTTNNITNNLYITTFYIVTEPERIRDDVKAMLLEIESIKRDGFNQNEVDEFVLRQKLTLSRLADKCYKSNSSEIVSLITTYDTNRDYLTEYHQDEILLNKIFNKNTIKDYNKAFNNLLESDNKILIVTTLESDLDKIKLDKKEFNIIEKEVADTKLIKYKGAGVVTSLINNKIIDGKIAKEESFKNINAELITFENGVRLLLKPNNAEKNKFVMIGKKEGGSSSLNDKDVLVANLVLSVVGNSGFDDISISQLRTYMADKRISITPSINKNSFDFEAEGDFQDIETMFQLLYKYVISANIDEKVLESILDSYTVALAGDEKNKYKNFMRIASKEMYNDKYRREYLEVADLKGLDKSELLEIYNNNFNDISNFIFVLVGDFDRDKVIGYAKRYLGSIPNSNKVHTKAVDRGVKLTKSYGKKDGYGDVEDRSTVSIKFDKDAEYLENGGYISALAGSIISIRLRERIREDKSGVYSSNVMISYSDFPEDRFVGGISFTTDPKKRDDIIQESLMVIENIVKDGITESELKTSKMQYNLQMGTASQSNNFWAGNLANTIISDDDILSEDELMEIINSITVSDINKFLKEYMDDINTFITVYNPEKK